MTLILDLPSDLEQRLKQEAQRAGLPPEQYAVQLLGQHLPLDSQRAELVALLRSWREGDEDEQRETGDYLVRALDEDRPSARKLFPPELEGTTW